MMISARRALTALVSCTALAAILVSPAFAASEGTVHFVKRTGPSFDRFTEAPTASFQAWMATKMWRSEVYTPHFDQRTTWYGQGWVYKDSYAIYPDQMTGVKPEWILKDGAGKRLYIPWGCSGGTCPQYAADITNPAYRAWWIAQARATVAKGYKGVWVDDVNLELRVGDGNGDGVRPIDRTTGAPMTDAVWRDAMATFMEELRAALPASAEVLHNSIWFAGGDGRDSTSSVRREIAAADYVNIERGVNDDGLSGGDGDWSLNALLGFVDRVHAAGAGVVFDAFDDSPQGREYNLAAYLLTSSGNDGVGLASMDPDTWWSGFDTDLGAACGPRTTRDGLLRREFAGGTVLVNEPEARTQTVQLGRTMTDTAGRAVTSVSLPARSGAVLRGSGKCAADTPPTAGAPAATAPAPVAPSTTTPVPATPTPPAEASTAKASATKAAAVAQAKLGDFDPSLIVRVPRADGTGFDEQSIGVAIAPVSGTSLPELRIVHVRAVASTNAGPASASISGRAPAGIRDAVTLTVHQRRGGQWVTKSRKSVVVRHGAFADRTVGLSPGRYRVVVSGGRARTRAEFTVPA